MTVKEPSRPEWPPGVSAEEAALIERRRLNPPPGEDLWVFAYGSLMWRPGFDFLDRQPALLRGYHRAFCVISHHYRGTAEKPGLVLGLDRGGACRGRAFRVAAKDADHVIGYLHNREMITGVYDPRWFTIETPAGPCRAAAFIVDRAHEQYAGKLTARQTAEYIAQGAGVMGTNLEYLRNTVTHLDELGIADGPLHRLLRIVEEAVARRP
jgi:cation transport protein ChaC